MPYRQNIFASGYVYHVFNRGVARMPIFFDRRDKIRALQTIQYYRFDKPPIKFSHYLQLSREQRQRILSELHSKHQKIVDIIFYVFMENHWHFIVKQNLENGISKFMSQVSDSFTKYVNTKQERVGPLFQGPFGAVGIETDNQLVHVSRYLHLNPLIGGLTDKNHFRQYEWSSLKDYERGDSDWCTIDPILSHFKSPEDYLKFVLDQESYARELKQIQHLLIEK